MGERAVLALSAGGVALWALPVLVLWWREARRGPRPTRAQRRAARARAARTLAALLTAEERAQLRRRGYLAVPSRAVPGRVYRIPRGGDRVEVYEGGRHVATLCVEPAAPLPAPERVLLHKLLLEGDERAYLRAARAFPAPPAPWDVARAWLARGRATTGADDGAD
ncbi:MAG TPA: hypothetical protein VFL91_20880 [Thermomicrobiales bacterium]|nr:hypothetical protein [Thermomicrobiales bacterium]